MKVNDYYEHVRNRKPTSSTPLGVALQVMLQDRIICEPGAILFVEASRNQDVQMSC